MEEKSPTYFGEWLKKRRKTLDLTQLELAERAGCSIFSLRKIEGGERRPSKQLAALLAKALDIPPRDHQTFIRVARGDLNIERLSVPGKASPGAYKPPLKPLPEPGNLPEMLTTFVGREHELEAVSQLLLNPQCRLLTITGPGGTGKTRLAVEVATRQRHHYLGGVWFVSLASQNSPESIVPTIAEVMNFRFENPARPAQQLLEFLSDKKALLVLDNVEHLLDGVGMFAEILRKAPNLKLLVTSRERLNLLSEWVFEIQGLPVPPVGWSGEFDQYSSVALFLQSARRVNTAFDIQEEDRQGIVRICQFLDGMPLGIELAAAWVGILSCDEIAREIKRNLDFLTITMRDLPERHRSLRATLDYSWNLLNQEERTVLSRLSVFRGSFRREAAEEICGATLAILSSLKDKSLVRRLDRERYDLHELIQQYCSQKLAEDPGEEDRIKNTHALYFAQRLAGWEKTLKSSGLAEALDEMALEIDDLRDAWRWMVTCDGEECFKHTLFSSSILHSSLFSVNLFFELRCRNWEAVSLFEESVESIRASQAHMDSEEDIQRYETFLGGIAAYLGLHYTYVLQYRKANQYMDLALGLLETSQARVEKAHAQTMLAWNYQVQGKLNNSIALLEQNLLTLQEVGDTWWYIVNLHLLGWAKIISGDVSEGKALYQEGMRLADPGDLRLMMPIVNGLAYALYLEKNYEEAEQLLRQNLDSGPRLGNKRRTAIVYLDLGQVTLATGRVDLAEEYFNETINYLSDFGESYELALGLIHSGKCLVAKQDYKAARQNFMHAAHIGETLSIFYLVFWALVNVARIDLVEGNAEKARQLALSLANYCVEYKLAQDDCTRLLADLNLSATTNPGGPVVDNTSDQVIQTLLRLA